MKRGYTLRLPYHSRYETMSGLPNTLTREQAVQAITSGELITTGGSKMPNKHRVESDDSKGPSPMLIGAGLLVAFLLLRK